MDKLIEFGIQQWPCPMKWLVLILMIMITIGAPVFAFWWLKKFITRDRYMFALGDRLYRLDTVTGKTSVARGFVFQGVDEWDSIGDSKAKKKAKEEETQEDG